MQHLRARLVAVAVVHPLEVVEVEEDHRYRVPEAGRAHHLLLQRPLQMARVEQSGVIVEDGQLLHLVEVARVLDGDGAELGDGAEDLQVFVVKGAVVGAVHQLDHAQRPVLEGERHAEDRFGVEAGGLVEAAGEPRVGVDVLHQERLVVLRHPARDPLARLEAHAEEAIRPGPHRRVEV